MVAKNSGNKARVNYLVCVNSEKYSETALHFVCQMAKDNHGIVTILHVIEPADYQTLGAVAEKMREETINEAENLLKKLADKAKKWGDIMPSLLVKEGLIEDEIIAVLEEDKNISMLITGTASGTSVKSKILPPLVASLGKKLSIPMLIIPGNLSNRQIEDLA